MTDEKRIEAAARAAFEAVPVGCVASSNLPLSWENLHEDSQGRFLLDGARFIAMRDADDAWKSSQGAGYPIDPYAAQAADLGPSKAGEQEVELLVKRAYEHGWGGKWEGNGHIFNERFLSACKFILAAQAPREVSREEIATLIRKSALTVDPFKASFTTADEILAVFARREVVPNSSDDSGYQPHKARPPSETAGADAPKPERRKGERRIGVLVPFPHYRIGMPTRQMTRRAPSPIAALEAENKRLRDEVERLEIEAVADAAIMRSFSNDLRDALKSHPSAITAEGLAEVLGAETGLNPGVEFSRRVLARLTPTPAELATLRASPLPVSAAEIRRIMAFHFSNSSVTNWAEMAAAEITSRLSASRTEAKGASGPVPLTAEVEWPSLRERMLSLMIGSCTCDTKSPELMFHNRLCHFRIATEAYDALDKLTWQVRDTCARAEKAEAALHPPPPADPSAEADRALGQRVRVLIDKAVREPLWVCAQIDAMASAAIAALASENGK